MTETDANEALVERLTDEHTPVRATAAPLTGAAAAEAGRAFLLNEYGSDDAIEEAIRVGRPKVGAVPGSGESPLVKGRIPESDYRALQVLKERTGKNQSALVREAVHLLLERHQLAS